jgi:ribonuclease HI
MALGGAAVLYVNQVEQASLCYHLGPSDKHTVYEGELVGLSLAVHLLTSLRFQITSYVIIGTDNQATIQALNNQRPHPGHYILDHIHDTMEPLNSKQASLRHLGRTNLPTKGVVDLQIHWTPGHEKFAPNKHADELAKQAS